MSNILAEIRLIKERLDKLVTLVDSHGSPKTRRPQQTFWKEIRSLIEELARRLRQPEEKVEISPVNQEADARIATSGPLPPTSDHTPNERQYSRQNSPRPLEEAQNNETNIQEISMQGILAADADASVAPPSQSDEHSQSIPRNPSITIPYREEHGVVALMPDKDQCRDVPYFISQAMELGAHNTGAFKYVLPDDLVADLPPILSVPMNVSKFKCSRYKENFCHISRTIEQESLHHWLFSC